MDSKEIKNQDDLIERLVTDGKDIVEDLVRNEMSREKSLQFGNKDLIRSVLMYSGVR